MRYQYLPNSSLTQADIIIQPISYGESVSARHGTASAPKEILKATEQLEYYDELLEWSPMKYLKIGVMKNIKKFQKITPKTERFKNLNNKLLIFLGGDHSITPQITKSLLTQRATILFLDAHADLRESYLGNKNSHATPAFQLLKQGHQLLMVGIRSLYEKEAKRVKKDKNIFCFSDSSLQKRKKRKELFQYVKNLEGDVYISIDMDVFNPAFVPSVGTPQPGGIDYYFALKLLKIVFCNKKLTIKGIDIVELIPEKSSVSQIFAAKLLQKIISYWGKSQGFHHHKMIGSQMQRSYE